MDRFIDFVVNTTTSHAEVATVMVLTGAVGWLLAYLKKKKTLEPVEYALLKMLTIVILSAHLYEMIFREAEKIFV